MNPYAICLLSILATVIALMFIERRLKRGGMYGTPYKVPGRQSYDQCFFSCLWNTIRIYTWLKLTYRRPIGAPFAALVLAVAALTLPACKQSSTLTTPAVVQAAADVTTSELLLRVVKPANQKATANWCACISRALRQFSGDSVPSAAAIKSAIMLETGPVSDPDFPILVDAAVDVVTAFLPQLKASNPSAATTVAYLNAIAAGVDSASAKYLVAQ